MSADEHAEVKMEEVIAHLDDTWFSWLGGIDDESVFYYRVHSPVVLIEFDHHPGVVCDISKPNRHHVHTLMRTPNGGDYGVDLLRQHHARYDHSHGDHRDRLGNVHAARWPRSPLDRGATAVLTALDPAFRSVSADGAPLIS